MSPFQSPAVLLSPMDDIQKRVSALPLGKANLPLALECSSPRLSVGRKEIATKSAFARLSYHVTSPLFDLSAHKLCSPTFSISFPVNNPDPKSTSPPPALGYSATSVSEASVYSLLTAAGERPPFDRSASMPHFLPSARSLDDQGKEMIDHQLEMLSQLFPKGDSKQAQRDSMNSLSQKQDAAMPADTDVFDITSDYQPTPNDIANKDDSSRISKLLSEWPAMDDIPEGEESVDSDAQSALAKLQAHPSMTNSSPPQGSSGPSVDLTSDSGSSYPASSLGSSLASRRSVNPHLSVDPAKTQKFAVKELELIRRMKDKGVAKPAMIEVSLSSP